jgi:hypothetical protein
MLYCGEIQQQNISQHSKESFQINVKCNNKGLTKEIQKLNIYFHSVKRTIGTWGTYAQHKFAVTGGKEKSNNTLLVTSLRKLHYTFAYLVNIVQQWFYAPMLIFMHQKQFFNLTL